LHARFDATEISASDGDLVSTWADETGNGYDLTAGTAPTYRDNIIGSNPVVRFDGSSEFVDVAFSALAQPNTIFVVAQFRSNAGGSNQPILDAKDNDRQTIGENNDSWQLFAGSSLTRGTADTVEHIWGGLFNGASSTLRVDGSQIASGDVGGGSLDGLTVGTNQPQEDFSAVDVGEILVYPQDKSGIESDVEQYLSDKWGITL
jgi:hypothetical protein